MTWDDLRVDAGRRRTKAHRYPAEVISRCVWLYHRFPLSFREVEELMLERGVVVSYETVRLVQNRRDTAAARRFFRRLLKNTGAVPG
jgi:putative transposase